MLRRFLLSCLSVVCQIGVVCKIGVVCATVPAVYAQPSASPSQTDPQTSDPQRVTILVDRQEKGAWHATNAATVFNNGDHVRFRVSINFPGYLYVMNHGTAGTYELLFPRSDTGSDNRIEAGKEYVVPANQGSFVVAGPAGYDMVYWLLSPAELSNGASPSPPPPPTGKLPSTLRPRCDDTVFKARGECIDDSAGVRPVAPGEALPKNLNGVGSTPRELLFLQDKGGVVLSSEHPISGPIVYELRLAHR